MSLPAAKPEAISIKRGLLTGFKLLWEPGRGLLPFAIRNAALGLLLVLGLTTCGPDTYEFVLSGRHSSPEGMVVKAWKSGAVIASDVVDSKGFFQCSFTHDAEDIILDSIRFSYPGYQAETYRSPELTAGPTRFVIQLPVQSFDFNLFGNNSTPKGMIVELRDSMEVLATDTVDYRGRYSCKFPHNEAFREIDTIKYSFKHYPPVYFVNRVLTINTELDVNMVLPECEVEQYGNILVSNDTRDTLWVDVTYTNLEENEVTLLTPGQSKNYQMFATEVLIWGSLDNANWQYHVYKLEPCENLSFVWLPNGKKGSGMPLSLSRVEGSVNHPLVTQQGSKSRVGQ